MNFVTDMIEKVYNPRKIKKAKACITRFDKAYKDVTRLMPENTIDDMIKHLSDQEKKNGI